jgi:hypothetical protein
MSTTYILKIKTSNFLELTESLSRKSTSDSDFEWEYELIDEESNDIC